MTDAEILQRLTGVLQDVFDDPDLQVTMDTTADQVPGWDSLTNVRLVVSTEMEFGARFDTAEISSLQNVGDLVHLIAKKTG